NSIGKDMAAIHFEIHSHKSCKLIQQKNNFENAIEDSKNILGGRTTKILHLLNILQDSDAICHGDFHPDNIMVYNKGYITIDWMNAYSGNPLSDVVRTQLMINGPDIPDDISVIMKVFAKLIKKSLIKAYTKKYCNLAEIDNSELDRWIPIIAASRLRENIPSEKKWLLSLIDKNLDN
ncbi:MAG: phosphotransferase, partial [Clostridiales bacterium]|nr:phosphotransferase [Clostridiales bacterium]